MLWDPLRFLESCPSSDGACAIVLTERGERQKRVEAAGVGRGDRGAQRARPVPGPRSGAARRRAWSARTTSTARPASRTRARRSTSPRSTCRSAGTSRCGSRATTSPARARAGRWSRAATPRSTGAFPVNASGGVLSSNPIGASGMLRFAEAALQVRGLAGEHQVDGARTALAPGLRRRRPVLRHGHPPHRPRLTEPAGETLRRKPRQLLCAKTAHSATGLRRDLLVSVGRVV